MKILIIYTGGTIGMRKSEKGYIPEKGYLDTMLKKIPELLHPSMPEFEVMEFDNLIDSSNADPLFWNSIVNRLKAHYNAFYGFVILHGTDTMAYTSSALSFMLSGNHKPVVLTGSQIPLCEIRNDARENIITSILLASTISLSEVCVYFNGKLFRGNRLQKTSVTGFDAFYSHNYPLLGSVGVKFDIFSGSNIQDLHIESNMSEMAHDVEFHNFDSTIKICTMRLFPGISTQYIDAVCNESFNAIVIESFGAGNGPTTEIGMYMRERIRLLMQKEILVVVKTQCTRGSVSFGFYQTSLKNAGAVSASDMTIEAIIAKLYYVLSLKNINFNDRRTLFQTNLCGEMKEHSK